MNKSKLVFLLCFLTAIQSQSVNSAVQFDGVDDYLSNTNGPLSSQGPFGSPQLVWSWGIWVKRFNTNSQWVFRSQHDTLANMFLGFRFVASKTNAAEIVYGSSQQNVYTSEPGLGSTTNVWIHFAMRHDSNDTNSTRFFVDGTEVAGAWTTGIGDGVQASAYPMIVGSDRGATFGYFLGQLDEFTYLNANYLSVPDIFNLAKSRLKGVALQIKANNNAVTAIPRSFTCNPFDGFPSFTAATSDFRDLSKFGRALNTGNGANLVNLRPNGGVLCVASAFSYQPNE